MGKFTKYILIMSGLVLLFYFTGLLPKTPDATLLNFLLDPAKLQTTDWYVKALGIINGAAAATIVVGTFLGSRAIAVLKVAFTIFAINIFVDFISVFLVVASVNLAIAILLFSPVLVLYVVAVIEWWESVGI